MIFMAWYWRQSNGKCFPFAVRIIFSLLISYVNFHFIAFDLWKTYQTTRVIAFLSFILSHSSSCQNTWINFRFVWGSIENHLVIWMWRAITNAFIMILWDSWYFFNYAYACMPWFNTPASVIHHKHIFIIPFPWFVGTISWVFGCLVQGIFNCVESWSFRIEDFCCWAFTPNPPMSCKSIWPRCSL